MWRKYRESITNKNLKRIKGRKTSLVYHHQVLSVDQIFTYTSKRRIFYHFYVRGNLPQIQKNKRRTEFLAIQLSKGSTILLSKIIRTILTREGSKGFFFIHYPVYSNKDLQYLLLLLPIQKTNDLFYYEDILIRMYNKFIEAINSLVSMSLDNSVD